VDGAGGGAPHHPGAADRRPALGEVRLMRRGNGRVVAVVRARSGRARPV
ncbi:MAG: hypothetical protein AVDCRST_MAG88-3419, partial [uncultured Thermomicrobiales bacterium]